MDTSESGFIMQIDKEILSNILYMIITFNIVSAAWNKNEVIINRGQKSPTFCKLRLALDPLQKAKIISQYKRIMYTKSNQNW